MNEFEQALRSGMGAPPGDDQQPAAIEQAAPAPAPESASATMTSAGNVGYAKDLSDKATVTEPGQEQLDAMGVSSDGTPLTSQGQIPGYGHSGSGRSSSAAEEAAPESPQQNEMAAALAQAMPEAQQARDAEENQHAAAYLAWKANNTGLDSATAQEVLRYSEASGFPPEYVAKNLDVVKQQVDPARASLEAVAAKSPAMRDLLSQSAVHPAAVKDDIDALSQVTGWLSDAWGDYEHAWKETPFALRDAVMQQGTIARQAKDMQGYGTPENTAAIEENEKLYGGEKDYGMRTWLGRGLMGIPKMLPMMVLDQASNFLGQGLGFLGAAAAGAESGPGAALTAGIGAKVGGFGGSWAFNATEIAAPMYWKLTHERGENGETIDPRLAYQLSMASGMVLGFGMAAAGGPLGEKGLTRALGMEMPKSVADIAKAEARWSWLPTPVQNAIKRYSAEALGNAFLKGEAPAIIEQLVARLGSRAGSAIAMMAAQAGGTQLTEETARALSGPGFHADFSAPGKAALDSVPRTLTDMGGIFLLHGAVEDVAHGTEAAKHIGTLRDVLDDQGGEMNSRTNAQRLAGAVEGAATSRSDPSLVEQAAAAQKARGGAQHVYVDKAAWDRLAQDDKADPREFAKTTIGDEGAAYDQAHTTGGEIVVPVEKFARLAKEKPELARALLDDSRIDLKDHTPRQIRERNAALDKRMAEVAKQAPGEMHPETKRVYDDMREMLEADGMEPAQADSNARLHAGFFDALAQRFTDAGTPKTAWDLRAAYDLMINGRRSKAGEALENDATSFDFGAEDPEQKELRVGEGVEVPSGVIPTEGDMARGRAYADTLRGDRKDQAHEFLDYVRKRLAGEETQQPKVPQDILDELTKSENGSVIDPEGYRSPDQRRVDNAMESIRKARKNREADQRRRDEQITQEKRAAKVRREMRGLAKKAKLGQPHLASEHGESSGGAEPKEPDRSHLKGFWEDTRKEDPHRHSDFYVDKDTGLFNERGWEVLHAKPDESRPFTAMFQAAGTKPANDYLGHDAADHSVKLLANALRDRGVNDGVRRGTTVTADFATPKEVEDAAKEMSARLGVPVVHGIAENKGLGVEALLRRVDAALGDAKKARQGLEPSHPDFFPLRSEFPSQFWDGEPRVDYLAGDDGKGNDRPPREGFLHPDSDEAKLAEKRMAKSMRPTVDRWRAEDLNGAAEISPAHQASYAEHIKAGEDPFRTIHIGPEGALTGEGKRLAEEYEIKRAEDLGVERLGKDKAYEQVPLLNSAGLPVVRDGKTVMIPAWRRFLHYVSADMRGIKALDIDFGEGIKDQDAKHEPADQVISELVKRLAQHPDAAKYNLARPHKVGDELEAVFAGDEDAAQDAQDFFNDLNETALESTFIRETGERDPSTGESTHIILQDGIRIAHGHGNDFDLADRAQLPKAKRQQDAERARQQLESKRTGKPADERGGKPKPLERADYEKWLAEYQQRMEGLGRGKGREPFRVGRRFLPEVLGEGRSDESTASGRAGGARRESGSEPGPDGAAEEVAPGKDSLKQPLADGSATAEEIAAQHGVKLFVGRSTDHWTLSQIVVPEGARGEGIGSQILEALAREADEAGKTISLTPATDFGATSKSRLIQFYKRFGFVENKGRNKDFSISDAMYRPPGERLFQPDDGGAFHLESKRGRGEIVFSPPGSEGRRSFDIRLLSGADASTLPHELGHFFGEVLADLAQHEDAPESIKQDYAELTKWQGYESHDHRLAEGKERRDLGKKIEDGTATPEEKFRFRALNAKEERLSHGLEQYFAEGKAPSVALARVFNRFARWMVGIYKGIAGIQDTFRKNFGEEIGLNDKVRDIFNRFLAADAEIEKAKEAQHAQLLGKLAEDATPEERAEYEAAAQKAADDAKQEMVRRIAEAQRKENNAFFTKRREELRGDVEHEIDQHPVYRAMRFLQDGDTPEAPGETPELLKGEDGEPMKLDRAEVVKRFGKEFAQTLPGSLFAVKGKGVPADHLAELLGFGSGDEMVRALQAAEPRGKRIAREVQDRMEAQYGPSLLDNHEALAEEAMDSLHNEAAVRKALLERRMMARKLNPDRAGHALDLDPEMLKTTAERLVREQTVGKLTSGEEGLAGYYLRAERTAAKRALKAMEAGKLDEALGHNETQILNMFLYRAAKDARARLERDRATLERSAKEPWRAELGKADVIAGDNLYLGTHDAILQAIKLQDGPAGFTALDALIGKVGEDNVAFDVPALRQLLAKPADWADLSQDQAQNVIDAVKNLRHAANGQNSLELAGKKIDRAAFFEEMGRLSAAVKSLPPEALTSSGKTVAEKAASALRGFDAYLTEISNYAETLDGGDRDGPVQKLLVDDRRAARAKLVELDKQVTNGFRKAYEAMPKALRRKMNERVPGLAELLPVSDAMRSANIRGPETRSDLYALMLNSGNADNRQRIQDGNGWSQAQVDKALNMLEPEEARFLQGALDTVQSLYPELAAAYERRHGLPMGKVEATPITINGEKFRGGYFPLKYDSRISRPGMMQAADVESAIYPSGYRSATVYSGHTKARMVKVSSPVSLEFGTLPSHLAQVTQDIAMGDWVRKAGSMVMDQQFRDIVSTKLGPERTELFKTWLRDIASERMGSSAGAADSTPGFGRMVSGLFRSRYSSAIMGLNFPSMLAHLTDPLVTIADAEGPFGMAARSASVTKAYLKVCNPATWGEHPEFALSKEIAYRDAREQDNIRKEIDKTRRGPGSTAGRVVEPVLKVADAINDVSNHVRHYMDQFHSRVIFLTGYQEGTAQGLTPEHAARMGDDLLSRSLPSGDIAEKSAILRSKSGASAVVLFHGYANKMFNLFVHRPLARAHDAWAGPGATPWTKASSAADLAAKWIVMGAIGSLGATLAGRGHKDEEDHKAILLEDQGVGGWMVRRTLLEPFNTIPFVGPGLEWIVDGKPVSTRTAPEAQVVTDVAGKIRRAIEKARNGEGGDDAVWSMLGMATSLAVPLPTGQASRTLGYAKQAVEGEAPTDPADIAKGVIYGPETRH